MVFKGLIAEIDSVMARDPAARSRIDVFLSYPSFHAIAVYRIASWLWRHNWRHLGLWLAQMGRFLTGIEIHPGAVIGKRLFIDHGMGVVIGEMSEIGDDVTLYHGVTLGGIAPSVNSKAQVGQKRHPTLEDGVIVGSGAQILGPVVVGECARVGANAVVVRDVPTRVTVTGIPARVVAKDEKKGQRTFRAYGMPEGEMPDPVVRVLDGLRGQVEDLMARVEELEEDLATARLNKAGETEEQKARRRGQG